tara:strand:+ start:399 stop:557 length:159 start_codon:yes stop_codon:yes gene_type:complete
MTADEFMDKLADWLQETVGPSWRWNKSHNDGSELYISSLSIWDLNEPKEEDE